MITLEDIISMDKNEIETVAKTLTREDIAQLTDWLASKDDSIRYPSFLLLKSRSSLAGDVYPFWQNFRDKLLSDNSYQRSIGLMLVAANARWDGENKIEETLDEYLALLHDEKPITIRQCIQGLENIVPYKPNLQAKTAASLMALNLSEIRETMRKPILQDILNVLLLIRKCRTTDEVEGYIADALMGGVLDKKAKKEIEARL